MPVYEFTALTSSGRKVKGIIDAELAKPAPDMAKVADIIKKSREKRPAVAGRHIDEFVAFYNTLDADQKAKVLARLRHFKERIDERFE